MLVGDRLVGMTSFGIEASVRQEPESVGRRNSKQCCTVKSRFRAGVCVQDSLESQPLLLERAFTGHR